MEETARYGPRYDSSVDRLIHFTSSAIIVGTDPLKATLDLSMAAHLERNGVSWVRN